MMKTSKKGIKKVSRDKKTAQNLAFSLGFGLYQVIQTRLFLTNFV